MVLKQLNVLLKGNKNWRSTSTFLHIPINSFRDKSQTLEKLDSKQENTEECFITNRWTYQFSEEIEQTIYIDIIWVKIFYKELAHKVIGNLTPGSLDLQGEVGKLPQIQKSQ